MSHEGKTRVLFICMGNICRSPMAACVFRHMAAKRGVADKWIVDSAGLGGWHVGGEGDYRMRDILREHGIDATHKVRKFTLDDYKKFDIIFGMDHMNMAELQEKIPRDCTAALKLFGEYDPEEKLLIRDPYYDEDIKGFENVYEQCVRCSNGLLDSKEEK